MLILEQEFLSIVHVPQDKVKGYAHFNMYIFHF